MAETRNCRHCGTAFSDSHLPDDISFLQAERLRLNAIIQKLNIRRTLVLQKFNNFSSTLPTEVLSEIFQHACPPPPFSSRVDLPHLEEDQPASTLSSWRTSERFRAIHSPITLGAVCSRWRQVAWNTPALWTSVDLRPLSTISSTMAAANLLQLYAGNVSGAVLNVQIIFHRPSELELSKDMFATAARPLARALFSQDLLLKTTMLVLSNPPPTWLADLSKGFVHLHTFVLVRTGSYMDPLNLANAPSLRHVSHAGTLDHIACTLPYDQLQTLTLRGSAAEAMLDLLLLCPNLTSYRARSPTSYGPRKKVDFSFPRTFPNLQHFEWPGLNYRWSREPKNIRLPALRYLHLHGELPVWRSNLVDFFEPLSKDIQTLHLTNIIPAGCDILDYLLPHISQLETLIIDNSHRMMFHAVTLLGPKSPSHPAPSNLRSGILPNLRTLRLENMKLCLDTSRFDQQTLSDSLVHLLMERMEMTNMAGGFKLEIVRNTMVRWSAWAEETLRRLIVYEGAPLRIFTDGEEMFRG